MVAVALGGVKTQKIAMDTIHCSGYYPLKWMLSAGWKKSADMQMSKPYVRQSRGRPSNSEPKGEISKAGDESQQEKSRSHLDLKHKGLKWGLKM